jgi:single-strand DNA-binding protein
MADLNLVVLIGRLTRDPVLRYTPAQTAICEFGLAVGRKFKTASGEQREETAFIDCQVWGKGGEIFNQYMSKGKQVSIQGRLKYDTWEDKATGAKRSKLSVNVDDFQFLGAPGEGGQRSDDSDQRPQSRRPAPPQGEPQKPYDDSDGPQFAEEEIPF